MTSDSVMSQQLSQPYLQGLNDQQREAVLSLHEPLLILAGAGTGKTMALTARLAHILATGGARPWEILALTFTNKAAREMRDRLAQHIGPAVENVSWLGTFHAMAVKILRRHAELVDLNPRFTILDKDDQIRLLRQVITASNLDEKRWTAKHLAYLVDGWKNKGLTPQDVPAIEGEGFAHGRGLELYALYQERLAALNACDFGDLLLHNLTLFKNNPDILTLYRQRFKHLLVDEYQDTNIAQYLWLRLLAKDSGPLCVVGDDDQAIYGWRGAEVDNILRFEKDFPGAKIIRLEQNYRSNQAILGAASSLIAHNKGRLGKNLWTDKADGEKISLRGVWDGEAEAQTVSDEIEHWLAQGRRRCETAVLVRASWQMRAFEERFIMLGLPYRVVGGPRFFERLEIRDAHAYLRLVRFEEDDLAFERIVNTPKRGIGEATLQRLQQAARQAKTSLLATARQLTETDELASRARNALKAFVQDIDRWRMMAQNLSHVELAERLLDESGYTAMWKREKGPQAAGRLENLKELIQAMGAFGSLEAYLEHVSLVMELDTPGGEDEIAVMTLHAAKGLEFPYVFLPGWEEGVFPSQRSLDEQGERALEEERRLAYVGLTRAREKAMILFAANRMMYGRWQSSLPSRFVDELAAEHVEIHSETGYGAFKDYRGERNKTVVSQLMPSHTAVTAPLLDAHAHDLGRVDDNTSAFSLGERVFHLKFGYGSVSLTEGEKLTVDFEKAGRKKVMAGFVERV